MRAATQRQVVLGAAAGGWILLSGFAFPLKPYAVFPEERRCQALQNFLEDFATRHLSGGKLDALQCEELVDPPESPWLATTLSYTYKNMTRILQICARVVDKRVEATLAATGGECVDDYFGAFAKIEEAKAAGKPFIDLERGLDVEADPGLLLLRPELVAWMSP